MRKNFYRAAGILATMLMVFSVLMAPVPVRAAASITDVITKASGTDGEISKKSKSLICSRFGVKKSDVKATSGGWSYTTGATVVVFRCKSTDKAKKVVKKFKSYIKTCKEQNASYGISDEMTNTAKYGRKGRYAIFVMLSSKASENKKGFDAAIKALS